MYQEPRPTCVTVIGWVWVIIGGLMMLSAAMGLLASLAAPHPPTSDPRPLMFRIFPVLATVQMCVAALGAISGFHFLKLKAWSRTVLEILTWLLLAFSIGFAVFWVREWLDVTSQHSNTNFGLMGALMGVVVTGIYAVPLGVMLKYLRGTKVKNAVGATGVSGA